MHKPVLLTPKRILDLIPCILLVTLTGREYPAKSAPSQPNTMNRKVYVIVYDPILENGQNLSDYLNWLVLPHTIYRRVWS